MSYAEELTRRRLAKEEERRKKKEQKELQKKLAAEEKIRQAKKAEEERIKKRAEKLKLSLEAKAKERVLKKEQRLREKEERTMRLKKLTIDEGIKIEAALAGLPILKVKEDVENLSAADTNTVTRNQFWDFWLSRTRLADTLLDFAILLKLRYNDNMNKLCLAWCLPTEDMLGKIDKTYMDLANEFVDAYKEKIEDKLVKVLAGNGSVIKGYKEEDITPDVEALKKLALRQIQASLITETNPAVIARTLDVLEKYEPHTQSATTSGDSASNALESALAKRYGNNNENNIL